MGDIVVLMRAVRLAVRAQKVRSEPLESVSREMCFQWANSESVDQATALRAASRGCRIVALLPGMKNTCLMRSLVAGSLLSTGEEVVLNVGFRKAEASIDIESHAWITVHDVAIDGIGAAGGQLGDYIEVMKIPMCAEKCGKDEGV